MRTHSKFGYLGGGFHSEKRLMLQQMVTAIRRRDSAVAERPLKAVEGRGLAGKGHINKGVKIANLTTVFSTTGPLYSPSNIIARSKIYSFLQ